ncbi:MAG: bifunctional UDP-N-acetylmuramoyl-tripeptide:D-alanyl-D-alanine ligase/alanine racemase [Bacteroidaceae bacterium]|nr:bifunctional UDP-N-acetylmuramoyl-tripeptide:D-alanyl-D-alanine ligase/alanine racemase [Bacteroidaceae bacterium]
MQYTVEQIREALNADGRLATLESRVTRLLTDSRSLSFPEETIFFAIKTRHGDGHNYIHGLYNRGVRNFAVNSLERCETLADANFIVTDDTLAALQTLAMQHRAKFDIPVIGITGSDGKTIVKEWHYQHTAGDYTVTRSPRSYNSQIGVPLSVWLLNEKSTLGIFEAGISENNEMGNLQRIIKPTIGIITNISSAHQENFSSLQEKCTEKLQLFTGCDTVIYNADDAILDESIKKSPIKAAKIAWSKKDPNAPLFIESVTKENKGTAIQYRYGTTTGSYRIPFVDDASIEDSINCLAAALHLAVSPEAIATRMAQLEPVAMRLEVKEGKRGCLIINDSYNSDTASLDIALDFMERRCNMTPGLKRTVILADIKQSGENAASLYGTVIGYLKEHSIEKFIGIGSDISSQAEAFKHTALECHFFDTTAQFIASPRIRQMQNECILIKGSRSFHFEEITEVLEKKAHQTILEVNLSALRDNLNYYRNSLAPNTRTICMVKASAYGAGALEVGRTLQDCNIDYLAVAVADEGAELRREGITTGIIVMNPEPSSFATLFDNKLEPEIYSFGMLKMLIEAAGREGITDYPVHIKVDTGMHRLGFLPQEIPALIEVLKQQNALTPRSIFSHFVGSDSPLFDEFSKLQQERFDTAAETLQQAFEHKILRHICNSAGAERFEEAHHDMVRLGIGLYGISPIEENRNLHPISTLKTIILQIHDVPANETVGYSRKGALARDSRIAALPIGYADGLNRHLGNGKGYCIVGGKKAPYIGNICMDVCMIDVTGIDCKEGDTVEIFGPQLPVTTVAEWLSTIPYEVLTSVSTRIKRVYYSD